MRKTVFTLWFIFTAVLAASAQDTRVYFSPNGGCTDAIIRTINDAKNSVLVQAYSFTSTPIAKALTNAKKRGVKISAILDDSNQTDKYSSATYLKNAGIETLIDSKHTIAHNKVIIVDERIVITGSFNFSKAAETSNAENLLIITDNSLAGKYTANWKRHAKHSSAYVRKTTPKKDSPFDPRQLWNKFFGK